MIYLIYIFFVLACVFLGALLESIRNENVPTKYVSISAWFLVFSLIGVILTVRNYWGI